MLINKELVMLNGGLSIFTEQELENELKRRRGILKYEFVCSQCPRKDYHDVLSKEEAVMALVFTGWDMDKEGKQYCPECAKKRKLKAKSPNPEAGHVQV